MLNKLLDYLYSIWFNFRVFPGTKAWKMPILISHRTKCKGLYKGCIDIRGNVSRFMVSLGIEQGTYGIQADKRSYMLFEKGGQLCFHGYVNICERFCLRIFKNGKTTIGDGSWFNNGLTISCCNKVDIGENTLGGWNVVLRDSDGHEIVSIDNPEVILNPNKPVKIGNHVWIGAEGLVSKGSKIADNCIVASRSMVNKQFDKSNCLLAGTPAKIVKENINWK